MNESVDDKQREVGIIPCKRRIILQYIDHSMMLPGYSIFSNDFELAKYYLEGPVF